MKVNVDQHGHILLEEVFAGVLFRTSEGNEYGVCMRDDTIEITAVGSSPAPRVYLGFSREDES